MVKEEIKTSLILRAIPFYGKYILRYSASIVSGPFEYPIDHESHNGDKDIGDSLINGIIALRRNKLKGDLEVIMQGDFSKSQREKVREMVDLYASSSKLNVTYKSRSIEPYLREMEDKRKQVEQEADTERFIDKFF